MNLVEPLGHKPTARRTTDTTAPNAARSGAVTPLIGATQRIELLPDADTYTAGNSYLGLVRQASHNHHERAMVCRALLKRGHAVDGLHLEKAYRKRT